MPYEFQVTRRVEFSDTDMAGLMHFSNFFRFMETAEHAFYRSLGHSVVLSRSGLKASLPRVHAECDYLAPLYFEDQVLVHLLVQRKGTRSLTYQFRFYKQAGSSPEEVARGQLTVVSTRRTNQGALRAISLPPQIASQIQEAPGELLAVESRRIGRGEGSLSPRERARVRGNKTSAAHASHASSNTKPKATAPAARGERKADSQLHRRG